LLPKLATATKTDLLIVDNDSDALADPGDTIQYTVTITNIGSSDLENVVFSDTIDVDTTLVPGSVSWPFAMNDSYSPITAPTGLVEGLVNDLLSGSRVQPAYASGETINIVLGTLAPGDTAIVTFQVLVDASIPSSVIEVCNQGTVSSDNSADVLTDDPDIGGSSNPTCTPVQTPEEEAIQDLGDDVDALVGLGSLKVGQANGLTRPLRNAIRSLQKGKTQAACSQLQDFINEVNQKVADGVLTQAEGDALIASANAIRSAVECTP
jgi:uncharacterized repeat protein (TIGR01451 family)